MSAVEPEPDGRVLRSIGAVYGVIVAALLTAIGVGVLGSPTYGAIAGLFGGVGAFLFLPWLLCTNAAENAESDVSYGEMLARWSLDFRLGVFGAGLQTGGVVILLVGVNLSEPDPALGLGAGSLVATGSALLAIVLGRRVQRTRGGSSGHDHRPAREPRRRRDNASERSTANETKSLISRLRPDTLGDAFGALFAASLVTFWLSLIGFVVYALLSPVENPTFTLADPPVAAAAGSWIGVLVSVVCYGVWSAWKLRELPRNPDQPTVRNPVRLLARVTAVFIAVNDDLNAYDGRLRRTVWAFFGAALWVLFTAAMLFG